MVITLQLLELLTLTNEERKSLQNLLENPATRKRGYLILSINESTKLSTVH